MSKFGIESTIAIGRQLIKADPEEPGAIITTYHSARLHLDSIPKDRFQMLVLDEAHKLRNLYGVEKPPQVAKRFRKALEERRFRFVLMLTATPLQNRLWDLYSLVDLLTVARGHQNPFGEEGMFARKFIADNREQARHLKSEARDEFRSIVYGYMSRVRRGDAKLYFPDRVVQMHKVEPTKTELELIRAIAGPIQKLNRLAQISILQALTSSPEALMAQLNNMARNGTVPSQFAATIRSIVARMPNGAKLNGLGALIQRLKVENPKRWRLVVFTGRLETQTTIQGFLGNMGLKVGTINGMSGRRNQETIARFRKEPPKRVLKDEVEISAVTGRPVISSLLKTSPLSGKRAEPNYFRQCDFTRSEVLESELAISDFSGRRYRIDEQMQSSVSGKLGHKQEFLICHETRQPLALKEAEQCESTGKYVRPGILETCEVTHKRVLPSELGCCAVTGKRVLRRVLVTSSVSGVNFLENIAVRSIDGKFCSADEAEICSWSGRKTHPDDIRICALTKQPIHFKFAEQCESTGSLVRPGVLETCEVSHKRVLPSELGRCAVTGKRVSRKLLVASSLSGEQILEEAAVRSAAGKFCAPNEATSCFWSGRSTHPDDLRICALTGLSIHFEFATSNGNPRLQTLLDLLNGTKRSAEEPQKWEQLRKEITKTLGKGRCQVESTALSPDQKHLAVCSEVRTLLGLRVHHAGLLYSIHDNTIIGRITQGKRSSAGWIEARE